MRAQIISTKLVIPPIQREVVPRPRLIEQLNRGLETKLTLVSTPAGYGKTILLSAWAGQCGLPVAWYTLDEGDNDLARFLSTLVAAVEKALPGIGERVLPLPQVQQPSALDQALASLINEVSHAEQPFVLVLDDYHLVREPAVHQAVSTLLERFAPQAHLVIASRADPPLQLARLRARSQLTELRLADLCFNVQEATGFLNVIMKLDLRDDLVSALADRTEGWIAGLQMAAISLRGAADLAGRVQAFSGSNRFILDFLAEEVLGSQPEGIQTFLMKTSILDQLCGDLCDSITGQSGSQQALEVLERENLFILPLDEERNWYRYHQLFLDLLRKRAQQHYSASLAGWHRNASAWFERSGDLERAIHHALAAGDPERAASLLDLAAQPFLVRSEIYTFRKWIGQLPEGILHAHPDLVLFHAWVLALAGSPSEAVEVELEWVEKNVPDAEARIGVVRSYLLFVQGETVRAVSLLKQIIGSMPEGEDLFRTIAVYLLSISDVMDGRFNSGSQMLEKVVETSLQKGEMLFAAGALCLLSEVHMRLGRLHEACENYQRVLTIAVDSRGQRLPIAAKALIGLGILWREWNDLEQAETLTLEGISLSRYLQEAVGITGFVNLARIQQSRGNVEGAREAICKALEAARDTRGTGLDDLYVSMYEALLHLKQGDLASVERWIDERRLLLDIVPGDLNQRDDYYKYHLLKYELLVLARYLIARNDLERALFWLEALRMSMEEQGRVHQLIETLLLSGLAYEKSGEHARAVDCFERCLSLAQPGGYVRLFLEEGPGVLALVKSAARRHGMVEYIERIMAAAATSAPLAEAASAMPAVAKGAAPGAPGGSAPLIEPLTEREMELLRLVAEGLSNQEIAQRLFLALPTVKWHLTNIYGKIGARSRTQAVAQARCLGLLPVD